ncbi:MAG: phosphoribosyltransferase, partial [Anaerolineae bacterium]|nr:phosphoribosyltransferase [Anaerolineae bacterium]
MVRKEVLSWTDVDRLIEELLPQFSTSYDALMMVTRGGIVPGGILSEALGIKYILTAAVEFHTGVQK